MSTKRMPLLPVVVVVVDAVVVVVVVVVVVELLVVVLDDDVIAGVFTGGGLGMNVPAAGKYMQITTDNGQLHQGPLPPLPQA